MNLKDLIWFLCAIALSTSKEIESDDNAASYAYSTVYRSFDSPAIEKDETKSEDTKTSSSSAEKIVYLSNPVYESIWAQEEDKPKPDEGAREITPEKTWNYATIVPDIQNERKKTSDATNGGPNQVKITTASVSMPVQTKAQSSSPLTMPIIQPGRLITPGLSAYASSKEEEENKYAEVTYDDSE